MGTPTTGHLWLVYIDSTSPNPANLTSPTWQLLGGQKGLSRSRSLGTVDVTDKDSGNESEFLPTNKESKLDLDHLVELTDAGQVLLEAMYELREVRAIKMVDSAGVSKKALAICTTLDIDAPEDGSVDGKATFQVTGGWLPSTT